jgi:hypothetical protein
LAKNTKSTYNLAYAGNSVVSSIYDYLYKDATIFLQRKKDIAQLAKGRMQINRVHISHISKEDILFILPECESKIDVSKRLNVCYHTAIKLLKKYNIILHKSALVS